MVKEKLCGEEKLPWDWDPWLLMVISEYWGVFENDTALVSLGGG